MPERLDRVTVRLRSNDVTLTWAARDALLEKLDNIGIDGDIRQVFEAVGASRPVRLSTPQQTQLLRILESWAAEIPDGFLAQHKPLHALKNTLIDDLHDAEQRQSE
jgi:hypothetical protein